MTPLCVLAGPATLPVSQVPNVRLVRRAPHPRALPPQWHQSATSTLHKLPHPSIDALNTPYTLPSSHPIELSNSLSPDNLNKPTLTSTPPLNDKMVKAVVAGAAGGIGQPLSLLLKLSPLVDELALYDVVNTPGVAADLSHISSIAKTTGYLPKEDGAKAAFKDADIIVIPAGVPRKPGMTRDDLFNINAGIVKGLIEVAAEVAPKAFILVISNPVNSTVPIAAEVLKAKGVFNPQRLFGVTTLDIVRAETFVAEISGKSNPQELVVPVIGGHSGETIVPLFSKVTPSVSIPDDKYDALVNRVQFGGDEVVKAKDGAGSATLSMAYAGFRFAEKVLKAIKGEKGLVEPSYVYLPGVPGGKEIAEKTGVDFFSVPIELGPNGAEKATDILGDLSDKEKKLLEAAVTGLKGNIKKGVDFAHNPPQK
ncbi:Malate dehydrogenase like protein [Verticillium longisporum]|uniref:malate dehydrogenase n=1 Tax=Verticillium longisporum TaxID=100787 RepID=A0A8I3ANK1_VERLO|nr:Malate dehydrogenase like protein [Verticillium longisporum]